MTLENMKLEKVKKSCNTIRKISTVLGVIAAILTVIMLLLSIAAFCSGDLISKALSESHLINIPAVNQQYYPDSPEQAIDEARFYYNLSRSVGLFPLVLSITNGVFALVFFTIRSIFSTIVKQDNPFTTPVIRRLTIVLIIASVILFFTAKGIGGILMGFFTYIIYTIMDYGRALQIQNDETL